MNYSDFLKSKLTVNDFLGFKPIWIPDFLFDFQRELTEWAIRVGRGGLFENCGLGKTPQELVWAENVLRKTNKSVLIFTPLSVAHQFVREGNKFGIEVHHARDGKLKKGINVVNYQRLHLFENSDLAGVVCDESSILKHEDAKTKKAVCDFVRTVPFVVLGTATPAPNDFMELGNSSDVLGRMTYKQVLGMFFRNTGETNRWVLRGHAKKRFWQWVSTWARAIRTPSDLGYDDGDFLLPSLNEKLEIVESPPPEKGSGFFTIEATTLDEQRKESRRTLEKRCNRVAEIAPKNRPFIAWCNLNAEGDLLEKLIPDAVQVSGSDSDEKKEEIFEAFYEGKIRVIVTKPKIGGFGLNWQHCSDMSFFVSHSWEMKYQCVRRCYRFGQKREVNVTTVASEAERAVYRNLMRKEQQSEELYSGIIREMSEFQLGKTKKERQQTEVEVPGWLHTLAR